MFKLIRDFKEFAVKGNMIDIAIGVIIGAAFSKVVDVLVKQILLPPLSLLTSGFNMENKKLVLREAVMVSGKANPEEVAIGYGQLLQVSVDFLIVSLTIFIVVQFMNRLKNRADDIHDTTVKTPKDIELLTRVANLLEKQNELLENKKTF